MITFAEYLAENSVNEASEMKFAEFKSAVEKAYAKYFPKSFVSVSVFKILGSYIDVKCYLANDNKECPSGYWDNDVFKVHMVADLPRDYKDGDVLPEMLTFEIKSNVIFKSSTDRAYAFQHEKVALRKFKGTPEQCIKKLDAVFKKVHDVIKAIEKEDRLTDNAKELFAKKGY